MTKAEIADWARAENARRARGESDEPEGIVLLEAECFSDEYAEPDAEIQGGRGPHSSILADLLAGACAGWNQRPDAAEFHEAMRAAAPDARQRAITGVLIKEGTVDQILLAHLQGAFTWPKRRTSRRRRSGAPCRLPADLELPPSRQRGNEAGDTGYLRAAPPFKSGDLCAVGTDGRPGRCRMTWSRNCGESRTTWRARTGTMSAG